MNYTDRVHCKQSWSINAALTWVWRDRLVILFQFVYVFFYFLYILFIFIWSLYVSVCRFLSLDLSDHVAQTPTTELNQRLSPSEQQRICWKKEKNHPARLDLLHIKCLRCPLRRSGRCSNWLRCFWGCAFPSSHQEEANPVFCLINSP